MVVYTVCTPQLPNEIRKKFKSHENYKTALYDLISSPFKVVKFNNFITDSTFFTMLREETLKVELNRKDNDLYSFWQSEDLNNLNNLPNINKFIDILKTEVGPLMSNIFNVRFNEKLSITASLYKQGDMLLCHDDKCEDRAVAFVYYLTGNGNEKGGAFDMFGHDDSKHTQPTKVVYSVPPIANSFLFFKVGNLSHHQVSEVLSQNFHRLSINGWFHSNKSFSLEKYKVPFPKLLSQMDSQGSISTLNRNTNLTYCTPSAVTEIQNHFEENSYMLLKNYFVDSFYQKCCEELQSNQLNWHPIGPPNRRNYETVKFNNLPETLDSLIKLLTGPTFIIYLRNITGLTLTNSEAPSKFCLEVQRWSRGCYSIASDNDKFYEKSGLDVYLFFNSNDVVENPEVNGGCTHYLSVGDDDDDDEEEEEDEEEDNELLNIEPLDNALIMVYRTAGDTIRFTKYIKQFITGYFYCLAITYYEIDDV